MSVPAPVFLISGPPGAGKSSVGTALAQRYAFGLHIPLDDLREWVVSGIAHPVPHWTDETTRQFALARTTAGQIARTYAGAGFVVTIDDVLFPDAAAQTILPALTGITVHKFLLLPPVETLLHRNHTRTNKAFDTSFLDGTIRHLHAEMSATDYPAAGWHVQDTGNLTLTQTVDAIVSVASRTDIPEIGAKRFQASP